MRMQLFKITKLKAAIASLFSLALVACIAPAGVLITVPQAESQQNAEMAQPIEMSRIPIDTEMPSGNSVAVDCQDPAADYPYTPYDWPEASAMLTLEQSAGASTVTIAVSNVRPDTYYTLWLRLRGTDANGMEYGGSPLTGSAGTALLPTSELGNALAALEEGRTGEANGFMSDTEGNATFSIELDYPIVNGAYPFQKFSDFDATDARYPTDEPRIYPVAIVGAGGPFTLRLVSHCTDGVGHGLVPGNHEGWFQWKFAQ